MVRAGDKSRTPAAAGREPTSHRLQSPHLQLFPSAANKGELVFAPSHQHQRLITARSRLSPGRWAQECGSADLVGAVWGRFVPPRDRRVKQSGATIKWLPGRGRDPIKRLTKACFLSEHETRDSLAETVYASVQTLGVEKELGRSCCYMSCSGESLLVRANQANYSCLTFLLMTNGPMEISHESSCQFGDV